MKQKIAHLIPRVILNRMSHGATPIQAWREHLRLSSTEVAQRLGVSERDYCHLERNPRIVMKEKRRVAAALGIDDVQLDC